MKQNAEYQSCLSPSAAKVLFAGVAVALGCFLSPLALRADGGDHRGGDGQWQSQDGGWAGTNGGGGTNGCQSQNQGGDQGNQNGQGQNGDQDDQGEGNGHGHGHFHFRHGTDILHLSLRTAMINVAATNGAVETNATGTVCASQDQQGNADVQKLKISVQDLETNAVYELLALVDDQTNLISVTNFTADANGNADLSYFDNGNQERHGHGHGHGHGHNKGGKQAGPSGLPAVLNPISQIEQLAIYNSSTQAVLTADLTMPDQFQYLVKRDLSTNSFEASLCIKANNQQTRFLLSACGLSTNSNYFLVLNGGIAETNTTDANGCVSFNSLPSGTLVLQVRDLELWDASNNVVLSTTLP